MRLCFKVIQLIPCVIMDYNGKQNDLPSLLLFFNTVCISLTSGSRGDFCSVIVILLFLLMLAQFEGNYHSETDICKEDKEGRFGKQFVDVIIIGLLYKTAHYHRLQKGQTN